MVSPVVLISLGVAGFFVGLMVGLMLYDRRKKPNKDLEEIGRESLEEQWREKEKNR